MARIRIFFPEDTGGHPQRSGVTLNGYSVIEIKREYARENVTWHLNEKKTNIRILGSEVNPLKNNLLDIEKESGPRDERTCSMSSAIRSPRTCEIKDFW